MAAATARAPAARLDRRRAGLRRRGGRRRGARPRTRRHDGVLHERAALEDHTFVDLQARRVQIALDAARRVDLDRALGLDVADHGALDDHLADIDLGLDMSAFADHEDVVGEHLAFEAAVDPDRAVERELAFERGTASEQRRDLTLSGLLCSGNHGAAETNRSPQRRVAGWRFRAPRSRRRLVHRRRGLPGGPPDVLRIGGADREVAGAASRAFGPDHLIGDQLAQQLRDLRGLGAERRVDLLGAQAGPLGDRRQDPAAQRLDLAVAAGLPNFAPTPKATLICSIAMRFAS